MTKIELVTYINASIERCFDLSRDVKVHQLSAENTYEKVIEGRTDGLFELNETVTWEAKHFGIRQKLKVKITKLERPVFFEDEMLKGAFRKMKHGHFFSKENGKTRMTDIFEYEVPFSFLGALFDKIILKSYMTRFLMTRNRVIKEVAEESVRIKLTSQI